MDLDKILSELTDSQKSILVAITQSPSVYYLSQVNIIDLANRKLIEVNYQMADANGNFASRLTDLGKAVVEKLNTQDVSKTAKNKARVDLSSFNFNIVVTNVPLPEPVKKSINEEEEIFPFSRLEVGQSFFVAEVPGLDIEQVIQRKASLANLAYSKPSGGTTTTKSGKVRNIREYSRKFSVRKDTGRVEDGLPNVGKNGIRVARVL